MREQFSTGEVKPEIQLVVFRLGDENYGIRVSKVKEIVRPVDIFPIPGIKGSVEGVINLRGEIIPIVRMNQLLGLVVAAEGEEFRKSRIVILDTNDRKFGFLVDEVLEVVRVSVSDMQAAPELGGGPDGSGTVRGIYQINGQMVIYLDLERIFTLGFKEWELEKAGV